MFSIKSLDLFLLFFFFLIRISVVISHLTSRCRCENPLHRKWVCFLNCQSNIMAQLATALQMKVINYFLCLSWVQAFKSRAGAVQSMCERLHVGNDTVLNSICGTVI